MKSEKHKSFQRGVLEAHGSADNRQNEMNKWIRMVTKESLGESKGFGPQDKDSQWQDACMHHKVKREFIKCGPCAKMLKIMKRYI